MQTTPPSATVAPSAQPGWQPAALAQAIHLRNQMNGSISWFFIIAVMTVVNSVLVRTEAQLTFVVGLAASQFVDGVTIALAREFDAGLTTAMTGVGLVVNLALAGIFALAGWLARRQHRWAVVAGMVLYALDSLLLLVFADWLGLIFHGLALFGMARAFTMMGQLRKLEAALAAGEAGAMQVMLTSGSGAAVLPAPASMGAPALPLAAPTLDGPVSAEATLGSVLLEPLSWIVSVPIAWLGLLMAGFALNDANPLWAGLALFFFGTLAVYLWLSMRRRLEVGADGVRYMNGNQLFLIPWSDMSGVAFEPGARRMTFWMGPTIRRVNEYGLPRPAVKRVKEVLAQQITARRIPVR